MVRRRQADRNAATRAALIEAAIAEIASGGLLNFNLQRVSMLAGVTTGAIQHQFGNRRNFLIDVIKKVSAQYSDEMRQLSREKSLKERIDALEEIRMRAIMQPEFSVLVDLLVNSKASGIRDEAEGIGITDLAARFETWWMWYFHDVDLPKDAVLQVGQVVGASFFGFHVSAIHREDPSFAERAGHTMFDMLRLIFHADQSKGA